MCEHVAGGCSASACAGTGRCATKPEEVVWGAWVTLDELREVLADPQRPFTPDGRLGMERRLAAQ